MEMRRRLRGALGFGVLGAVGFHLVGWAMLGFDALVAGTLPPLGAVIRMAQFTIPVGATVGLLSAGAIALGAGASKAITQGRAFLLGLPLGFVGGLLMAAGLPPGNMLFVAGSMGLATGAAGFAAVRVANRAIAPRAERNAVDAGDPDADRLEASGGESVAAS